MSMWPREDINSMNAFYGDPDHDGDGIPDPVWQAANIIRITPPYPMVLAWAPDQPVKSISIHKKCAESVLRALKAISDNLSVDDIIRYQLNRYGGAFQFRMKRGANSLSVHSWGAAIDLSTTINSFGAEYGSKPNMMPLSVVNIFKNEGWVWGGMWHMPDAQHFQAATLALG